MVAVTGFNSSPKTKGALFRAKKPLDIKLQAKETTGEDLLEKYQAFFDAVYAEGALDRKTKHLIALGASLAAGCEQGTRCCHAVARQSGATDEELEETMALAMTVGATKIRILQEKTLVSLNGKRNEQFLAEKENEAPASDEACST